MKEIFGIRKITNRNTGEERDYWQRIGTALENKDGSLNLFFDFFPTKANTKIQVRDKDESSK